MRKIKILSQALLILIALGNLCIYHRDEMVFGSACLYAVPFQETNPSTGI